MLEQPKISPSQQTKSLGISPKNIYFPVVLYHLFQNNNV